MDADHRQLTAQLSEVGAFDGRVPPPSFVSVETTRYCNLRCRMCLLSLLGQAREGPHMAIEDFEAVAHQLFPVVKLFQPTVSAEPLMTKDFARMLELAAHYGVKVDMATNGTLLDEHAVQQLLPVLARLSISFDGACRETYERIRLGARFARVLAGIRGVLAARAALPEARQPRVGLCCTLMRTNIEELPRIVDLCRELGLDFLDANHVFPYSEEMKRQSLIHDRELARASIAEAALRASEFGVNLTVAPLDQVTATTALGDGTARKIACRDGIVPGLERVEIRPRPDRCCLATWDVSEEVAERRRRGRWPSLPRAPAQPGASPELRKPIWVCHSLWNRTYVHVQGHIKPCCIAGAPITGQYTSEGSFEKVWNNHAHRALRQRIVTRDPVSACRGCRNIREVSDHDEARRWLGGRRVPEPHELVEVPEALRAQLAILEERASRPRIRVPDWPSWTEEQRPHLLRHPLSGPPPRLGWEMPSGSYCRIEVSRDDFGSINWCSEPILEPQYTIPRDVWAQADDGLWSCRVVLMTERGDRVIWKWEIEVTG